MRSLRPALAGSVLLGSLVVGVAAGPPAYADEQAVDCSQLETGSDPETTYVTRSESAPLAAMQVPEATAWLARKGIQPGQGVTVAVLDSGVPDIPGMDIVRDPDQVAPATYYHGAAVAGLIAGPARADADGGPIGIAPAARIYDVRVYADPNLDSEAQDASITLPEVLAGLDRVLARVEELNIKVVTIALALPFDDKALRLKIAQLWKRGVVVVASTGNRPLDETNYLHAAFATHESGEDAKDAVHPADIKHVLGVNASMTGVEGDIDPTAYVLENSATDVAAPTAAGVSYTASSGTCDLEAPATSWSAAEASGVLALLQSYYDEKPAQAVSRLLHTANGRPDVPNTLVGAGDIQVLEALTRPMEIDEAGTVISEGEVVTQPQQVSAPEEPPDLLAATRHDAVWWGLLGGGTLLLALVLRPVLARRRRTVSGL